MAPWPLIGRLLKLSISSSKLHSPLSTRFFIPSSLLKSPTGCRKGFSNPTCSKENSLSFPPQIVLSQGSSSQWTAAPSTITQTWLLGVIFGFFLFLTLPISSHYNLLSLPSKYLSGSSISFHSTAKSNLVQPNIIPYPAQLRNLPAPILFFIWSIPQTIARVFITLQFF